MVSTQSWCPLHTQLASQSKTLRSRAVRTVTARTNFIEFELKLPTLRLSVSRLWRTSWPMRYCTHLLKTASLPSWKLNPPPTSCVNHSASTRVTTPSGTSQSGPVAVTRQLPASKHPVSASRSPPQPSSLRLSLRPRSQHDRRKLRNELLGVFESGYLESPHS